MPVLKFKTEEGWVEVPALKGDTGDLTIGDANLLYAPLIHDHDADYYTRVEIDTLLSDSTNHDHDGRYYTETEVDSMVSGLANAVHVHDDRYFTQSLSDGRYSLLAHDHDAANITGGTLSDARIPPLSAAKITSGVFSTDRIPELPPSLIPSLDTGKITSGVFSSTRIPSLGDANISGISGEKITAGKVHRDRIPQSNAVTSYYTHNGLYREFNLADGTWVTEFSPTVSGLTPSLHYLVTVNFNQVVIGALGTNAEVIQEVGIHGVASVVQAGPPYMAVQGVRVGFPFTLVGSVQANASGQIQVIAKFQVYTGIPALYFSQIAISFVPMISHTY